MANTGVRVLIEMLMVAAVLLGPAGCKDSNLSGVRGRWSGDITCFGQSYELTMSLSVDGQSISGTGRTRLKDTPTSWTVKGHGAASCAEDTCNKDQDCPRGLSDEEDGAAGELRKCDISPTCKSRLASRPECQSGAASSVCDPCAGCTPCQLCAECQEDWLPILLTLVDEDVTVPDPTLKLWSVGGVYLKGSVSAFCPDEESLYPKVLLHKE